MYNENTYDVKITSVKGTAFYYIYNSIYIKYNYFSWNLGILINNFQHLERGFSFSEIADHEN